MICRSLRGRVNSLQSVSGGSPLCPSRLLKLMVFQLSSTPAVQPVSTPTDIRCASKYSLFEQVRVIVLVPRSPRSRVLLVCASDKQKTLQSKGGRRLGRRKESSLAARREGNQ